MAKGRETLRALAGIAIAVLLAFAGPAVALAVEDGSTAGGGDIVAQIGEKQFTSFGAAWDAVQDGETVTLLDDVTLDKGLTLADKSVTIDGGKTLTLNGLGIWATNSKLTFSGCTVNITASQNPNYSGATANLFGNSDLVLDNGASVSVASDGKSGASGLYLYQESNLYISGASHFTVSGYNTDRASGIYCDSSEYKGHPNRKIVVDGYSTLSATGCYWHGLTVNPVDITVSNGSTLTATDNGNSEYGGGIGCYYGKLTVSGGSKVVADKNNGSGWGIFVKELSIDGISEVSACGNAASGLTVGGKGDIESGATLTLNDNAETGLWVYTGSDYWFGDVTIASGAKVDIERNHDNGIYVAVQGKLALNTGTVTNNTGVKGGGIYNRGTATIDPSVQLYNNHASTAGDDIYNTPDATITFGTVGPDWWLDGTTATEASECTHAIDGWYDDAEDTRWNAQPSGTLCSGLTTERHVQLQEPGTIEGAVALKAAHGDAPVSMSLHGTKTLTGATLTQGTYSFQVTPLEGAPLPADFAIAKNAQDGSITFADITYDVASVGSTYSYVISECISDNATAMVNGAQMTYADAAAAGTVDLTAYAWVLDNVTYDAAPVVATVTVGVDPALEGDCKLTTSVAYTKAGTAVDDAAFTNVYTAPAEEEPQAPATGNTNKPASTIKQGGSKLPKTGDASFPVGGMLAVAAVLVAGAGVIVARQRARR